MKKKPIYKRVWPYVVAGALIVGGIGGGAADPSEPKETEAPSRAMPVETVEPAAPTKTPEPTPEPKPVPAAETPAPLQALSPTPAQEALADRSLTAAPIAVPELTPEPQPPAPVETPNVKGCFVTPTGKRYHFDRECAGPNAIAISLENAVASGYGPCKTCAGG